MGRAPLVMLAASLMRLGGLAASCATTNSTYEVDSARPESVSGVDVDAAVTVTLAPSPSTAPPPAAVPANTSAAVGAVAMGSLSTTHEYLPASSSCTSTTTLEAPLLVMLGVPATKRGTVTSAVVMATLVGLACRLGPGLGAASSAAR